MSRGLVSLALSDFRQCLLVSSFLSPVALILNPVFCFHIAWCYASRASLPVLVPARRPQCLSRRGVSPRRASCGVGSRDGLRAVAAAVGTAACALDMGKGCWVTVCGRRWRCPAECQRRLPSGQHKMRERERETERERMV